MTSNQDKINELEKMIVQQRFEDARQLRMTMIAESGGRLNYNNCYIFSSGHGIHTTTSVFVRDENDNTLAVVGSLEQWTRLQEFVKLMCYPSQEEIEQLADEELERM